MFKIEIWKLLLIQSTNPYGTKQFPQIILWDIFEMYIFNFHLIAPTPTQSNPSEVGFDKKITLRHPPPPQKLNIGDILAVTYFDQTLKVGFGISNNKSITNMTD